MVVMVPILFASSEGIKPRVDAIGYQVVHRNFLFDVIAKNTNVIPDTGSLPSNKIETKQDRKGTIVIDKTGKDITEALKAQGYNAGFISSNAFVDLGFYEPDKQIKEEIPVDTAPKQVTLDDLVARPTSPQFVNFLRYPKYNINTPIIYSSLEDLFNLKPNCNPATDPQGCLDFGSPRDNGPANSPVQLKLRDGVVHIAFTPMPGEIGNSYIVGHSSNFSWVPSAYNEVFKPIERKSQPGETFIIYDRFGRELNFKVFEVLEISESDTATAYINFENRRVVTLQTSILEFVPGRGFLPTKRWITRGELVV